VAEVGLCLCFPIALFGSKPTKELAFSSWSPKIFVQSTSHLGQSHFLGAFIGPLERILRVCHPLPRYRAQGTREASHQLPNCTL
jgi:hypothetical protein